MFWYQKSVFKCLTLVLTRCPVVHIWMDHMGRVQPMYCFVCSGISLPQQINTFILCIFLILEFQSQNSCLNSFPEISGTSVSEVAALPATFFSGTKPPIASSDSGAFPENSPQCRTEQVGRRKAWDRDACARDVHAVEPPVVSLSEKAIVHPWSEV